MGGEGPLLLGKPVGLQCLLQPLVKLNQRLQVALDTHPQDAGRTQMWENSHTSDLENKGSDSFSSPSHGGGNRLDSAFCNIPKELQRKVNTLGSDPPDAWQLLLAKPPNDLANVPGNRLSQLDSHKQAKGSRSYLRIPFSSPIRKASSMQPHRRRG